MRTFFVGLKNKLLIIAESAEGYSAQTRLDGKKINRLAVDPEDKARMYAATSSHGLWRTENSGEHWERIGEDKGLELANITSVAVNPIRRANGKSVIYAGTEPSHLYYSEDHGESWMEFENIQELPSKENWRFPPRPETHYVRWITPSYSNTKHIALSIEAGAILHTNNHGESWHDRPAESPIDIHTLLAHPKKPNYLYAANGDGGSKSEKSYAESSDGGKTWNYKSAGLEEHPYLYNMVFNSSDPAERLVSASKSASKAHRQPRYSTVYKKVGEDPWIELADGLPREGAYTHYLAEDPLKAGVYYALNNYGIYYLPVGKEEWEKLAIDVEEKGFAERPYSFIVLDN